MESFLCQFLALAPSSQSIDFDWSYNNYSQISGGTIYRISIDICHSICHNSDKRAVSVSLCDWSAALNDAFHPLASIAIHDPVGYHTGKTSPLYKRVIPDHGLRIITN